MAHFEKADVDITNEGTVLLFELISEEAIEWWAEHVEECITFCGKYIVDHRPATAIIDGLVEAGFTIEGI